MSRVRAGASTAAALAGSVAATLIIASWYLPAALAACATWTAGTIAGWRTHQRRRRQVRRIWERASADAGATAALSRLAGHHVEVRRIPGSLNAFLIDQERALITEELAAADTRIIIAVLAHEAGHLHHRDLRHLAVLETPVETAARALRPGAGGAAWAVALLASGAVVIVAGTVAAALIWRRHLELRADTYAIATTGDPDGVCAATAAAHRHSPLSSHPAPSTRIRAAARR